MLSVVMISRSTLFTVKGGDTVQVEQTAKHLLKLGVKVDIKLANEYIDYSNYDLLHFFNITRPADIICHINDTTKPFVISTIHIDYSGYDKHHRKGFPAKIFSLFSDNTNEYLKTIYRGLLGKDKFPSTSYLLNGQRRSIEQVLQKVKILLPNSENEYARIKNKFKTNASYKVVLNAVDDEIFVGSNKTKKDSKLVLCVARIEGIKNQLNLIKAINNTEYKLIIIGAPAPNQSSYYESCKKIAGSTLR